MRSVTVIIVNYRAAELVLANLPRLTAEKQGVEKLEVIIVENGSGDGSAERLAAGIEALPKDMRPDLVVSERNGGFAAGNNIGFARIEEQGGDPDGILLLNPDTELPEKTLPVLIAAAESREKVGVVGGRALKEDGSRAGCAYRFPSLRTELGKYPFVSRVLPSAWKQSDVSRDGGEPVPCDWVSGSCFLITKAAWQLEPRFDERYFLYFEETDYCRRIKAHGLDVLHAPEARYTHIGGQSTGISNGRAAADMPTYWYESWRRYFVQNDGAPYAVLMGTARMLNIALWQAVDKRDRSGKPTIAGFWQHGVLPTLRGRPL
jgi:GT2 family glycosyltransferase